MPGGGKPQYAHDPAMLAMTEKINAQTMNARQIVRGKKLRASAKHEVSPTPSVIIRTGLVTV